MNSLSKLFSSRFSIYKPKPILKVSEWADKYLMLPAELASEPGQWRTSRAEYQRGIMDACNDPEVKKIVGMTSAQVGKSSILDAIMFYHIHQDPCPILYTLPTLADAEDYSKTRLSPIIRDCEVLSEIFEDGKKAKTSGDTILKKQFPGGLLALIGSNSVAGLSRVSMRLILNDEIDKYEETKEGDPIKLSAKRAQTFFNSLQVLMSTPTIKGASKIEQQYERSDKRKYYVPCPRCKKFQILSFGNIKFERTENKELIEDSIYYECSECRKRIDPFERDEMVKNGKWIAEKEFNGTAGFWINELYSPWSSWADMVKEFLITKDNNSSLQTFVNLALGETWVEEGITVDGDDLLSRREDYGEGVDVPEGGLVLVGAVDVQDDRLEYEIIAYGVGQESWSVDYGIIQGDVQTDRTWKELEMHLLREYKHENGSTMTAACVCIDSGGHATDMVYNFCKRYEIRRWFAVRGHQKSVGKPITPAKPSIVGRVKCKLFNVGVDAAKTLIYSRLKIEDDHGPGVMHFPMKYNAEYFLQLTAEKAVNKVDNSGYHYRKWIKIRTRNEALDLRVYTLCALGIINPNFKLLKERGPYTVKKGDNVKRHQRRRSNGVTL